MAQTSITTAIPSSSAGYVTFNGASTYTAYTSITPLWVASMIGGLWSRAYCTFTIEGLIPPTATITAASIIFGWTVADDGIAANVYYTSGTQPQTIYTTMTTAIVSGWDSSVTAPETDQGLNSNGLSVIGVLVAESASTISVGWRTINDASTAEYSVSGASAILSITWTPQNKPSRRTRGLYVGGLIP